MLKISSRIKKTFYFSNLIKHDERGQLRRYQLEEGQEQSNFFVKKVFPSKEYNAIYYEFIHKPSGAKYVHLSTINKNNQGALALYTPPQDDRGIPHIVHRMCCAGSEKYPVRDAWSQMHSRSFNPKGLDPFLGPDFAVYPIQSSHQKDFYNLFDLTFTQVFNSWNRKVDYLMEGVRKQIIGNELFVRGEVYEDMKNNFNMGEFIQGEYLKKNLLKGSIYEYCAGGTPSQIRTLEFQNVQQYYKDYINTSNSSIMTLGDMSLDSHLEYFDKILQNMESGQNQYTAENYKLSKDFSRRQTLFYPPQREDQKLIHISLAFRGADLKSNPEDYMKLNLMMFMLHEIDSIGMQSLLSDETPQFAYNYGTNSDIRLPYLNFGLACQSNQYNHHEQRLLNLIYRLKDNIYDVIPKELIDSALKRTQMKRYITLNDIYTYVIHSVDPKYFLSQTLTKDLSKKIHETANKYLSQEYCTVILEPRDNLIQENELSEKKQIKFLFSQASDEMIQIISEDHQLVKSEQEKIQSLQSLPKISVQDMIPMIEKIYFENFTLNQDVQLTLQPQKQQGSSTIIITFEISNMATSDQNQIILMQYLQPHFFNRDDVHGELKCEIKQTKHNKLVLQYTLDFLDQDLEINLVNLSNTISDPQFDDLSQISEILQEVSAQIGNDVVENAIKYAIDYSSSPFSFNQLSLLEQMRLVCKIEVGLLKTYNIKDELCKVSQRIISTYFKLMNKNKIKIFVSTNPNLYKVVKGQLNLFVSALKLQFEDFTLQENEFDKKYEIEKTSQIKEQFQRTYVVIPSGSNYVTETVPLMSYFGSPRCPSFHILSSLLNECFLLQYQDDAVYQTASTYCPLKSTLTFYTYRDPHTVSSYNIFEEAIQNIVDRQFEYRIFYNFSKEQLDLAKISLLRRMYQKEHPYNINEFLNGISEDDKTNYISSLILVDEEQIVEAAKTVLQLMAGESQTSQVIFGINSKGLDELVKRGWLIERVIEDISIKPEQYSQVQDTVYEVEEQL